MGGSLSVVFKRFASVEPRIFPPDMAAIWIIATKEDRPLSADFVEKGGGFSSRTALLKSTALPKDQTSGRFCLRHRDELGELPEVLGCSCEVELISGTIRSS